MRYSTPEKIAHAVEKMKSLPHLEAAAGLPELFTPQVDNSFSAGGNHPFQAMVFNIECGTRFDKILLYLKHHPRLKDADIILGNELDWGMARSQNLHITRELARALGMNYAFATEFITVRAGQDGNREGWHGNAILSRFPLKNVSLLRLPIMYEWFYRPNDSRLGTRVALLAEIQVQGQAIGLVSLHLENRATPKQREAQFRFVLDHVETVFAGLPVLIGGDMNTNTVDGDAPDGMDLFIGNPALQNERMANIPDYEPLMACAQAYGYSYQDCNLMAKSTRRRHTPGQADILLNLDWFFQRGLYCDSPHCVKTVFDHRALVNAPHCYANLDGQELSDHDAITVRCALTPRTENV